MFHVWIIWILLWRSDALGRNVMDQREDHESLLKMAGTLTFEEVAGGDDTAGWLLRVVSDLKLSRPPPPLRIGTTSRLHFNGWVVIGCFIFAAFRYTTYQIRKMEESTRLRKESEPTELIRLVSQLKKSIFEWKKGSWK